MLSREREDAGVKHYMYFSCVSAKPTHMYRVAADVRIVLDFLHLPEQTASFRSTVVYLSAFSLLTFDISPVPPRCSEHEEPSGDAHHI